MNIGGFLRFSVCLCMITRTHALLCYWCSGVGNDRECERHPDDVRTGPIFINCRSRFCITARVTDARSGEVQSFARLCDNISRGNKCVRDSRLTTCYQSCSTDMCNSGNPSPSHLHTLNYASHDNHHHHHKNHNHIHHNERLKTKGVHHDDASAGPSKQSVYIFNELGPSRGLGEPMKQRVRVDGVGSSFNEMGTKKNWETHSAERNTMSKSLQMTNLAIHEGDTDETRISEEDRILQSQAFLQDSQSMAKARMSTKARMEPPSSRFENTLSDDLESLGVSQRRSSHFASSTKAGIRSGRKPKTAHYASTSESYADSGELKSVRLDEMADNMIDVHGVESRMIRSRHPSYYISQSRSEDRTRMSDGEVTSTASQHERKPNEMSFPLPVALTSTLDTRSQSYPISASASKRDQNINPIIATGNSPKISTFISNRLDASVAGSLTSPQRPPEPFVPMSLPPTTPPRPRSPRRLPALKSPFVPLQQRYHVFPGRRASRLVIPANAPSTRHTPQHFTRNFPVPQTPSVMYPENMPSFPQRHQSAVPEEIPVPLTSYQHDSQNVFAETSMISRNQPPAGARANVSGARATRSGHFPQPRPFSAWSNGPRQVHAPHSLAHSHQRTEAAGTHGSPLPDPLTDMLGEHFLRGMEESSRDQADHGRPPKDVDEAPGIVSSDEYDAAFVKLGYSRDGIDNLVSTFRQHPINRHPGPRQNGKKTEQIKDDETGASTNSVHAEGTPPSTMKTKPSTNPYEDEQVTTWPLNFSASTLKPHNLDNFNAKPLYDSKLDQSIVITDLPLSDTMRSIRKDETHFGDSRELSTTGSKSIAGRILVFKGNRQAIKSTFKDNLRENTKFDNVLVSPFSSVAFDAARTIIDSTSSFKEGPTVNTESEKSKRGSTRTTPLSPLSMESSPEHYKSAVRIPSSDVTHSAVRTKIDDVGTAAPIVGTDASTVGTVAPIVGTTASTVGTVAPIVGTDASTVGTVAHIVGTDASTVGTVAPIIGTPASTVGTVASIVGTDSSTVGTVAPIVGTGASIVGTVASIGTDSSIVGTVAPVVGTAAPIVGTTASTVGTVAPILGTDASIVGTVAPIVGTTASTVGTVAPIVGTDASIVGTVAPIVGTDSSTVGTVAHIVGTDASTVGTVAPNVVSIASTTAHVASVSWNSHSAVSAKVSTGAKHENGRNTLRPVHTRGKTSPSTGQATVSFPAAQTTDLTSDTVTTTEPLSSPQAPYSHFTSNSKQLKPSSSSFPTPLTSPEVSDPPHSTVPTPTKKYNRKSHVDIYTHAFTRAKNINRKSLEVHEKATDRASQSDIKDRMDPTFHTDQPETHQAQQKTRTDHPETRTDQPETRTDHPETRTDHPDTRTDQPEIRTDQPETRTDQPDTLTDQPEIRTDQPDTRTDQPEIRTHQPEIRTHQPDTRTGQPETSTDQPEIRTDQPDTRTDQPETSTDQPETSTDQPKTSTDQPETSTDHPETSTDQPETSTDQPETRTDHPDTRTYHPETRTYQPEIRTDQPDTRTDHPDTRTDHPEIRTDHPEIRTYHPEIRTDHPDTRTDHPEIRTYHPEIRTDHPDTRTDHPEIRTDQPEIRTYQPEIRTDQPDTRTDQPETSTDQPETSTDQPKTSTDQPETSTDHPETSTDQPETSTDQPETRTDQPETSTDHPEAHQVARTYTTTKRTTISSTETRKKTTRFEAERTQKTLDLTLLGETSSDSTTTMTTTPSSSSSTASLITTDPSPSVLPRLQATQGQPGRPNSSPTREHDFKIAQSAISRFTGRVAPRKLQAPNEPQRREGQTETSREVTLNSGGRRVTNRFGHVHSKEEQRGSKSGQGVLLGSSVSVWLTAAVGLLSSHRLSL